jgi:hypothetical protein
LENDNMQERHFSSRQSKTGELPCDGGTQAGTAGIGVNADRAQFDKPRQVTALAAHRQ